jgi:hypothetical protein
MLADTCRHQYCAAVPHLCAAFKEVEQRAIAQQPRDKYED